MALGGFGGCLLGGNCSQLEKWRSGLTVIPRLLNTQHTPFLLFYFFFFFQWLPVKEDVENISGKRRRYTHLLVSAHTHTQAVLRKLSLVAALHLSAY